VRQPLRGAHLQFSLPKGLAEINVITHSLFALEKSALHTNEVGTHTVIVLPSASTGLRAIDF